MKNEEKESLKQKINTFLILYFKWIAVLSIIAILVLGYFFLIKGKLEKIKELDKSIEEQKQNFLDRESEIKKIEELVAFYEKIDNTDVEKINFILPDEEISEKLFPYIESMVIGNGLLLESLDIHSDANNEAVKSASVIATDSQTKDDDFPENISKVSVIMEVLGINYSNFKNLLAVMENNLRLMDVSKLNFDPESDSASLEFYIYYFEK